MESGVGYVELKSIKNQDTGSSTRIKAKKVDSTDSQIKVVCGAGRVHHLGWDTEGGNRFRHNLLRAPLQLSVRIGMGEDEWVKEWQPVDVFNMKESSSSSDEISYRFEIIGHYGVLGELSWSIKVRNGGMTMRFACSDRNNDNEEYEDIKGLKLVFPFNLNLCASNIIAGKWTNAGRPVLPAIISAPDLGEMLVRCDKYPELVGLMQSSYDHSQMQLGVEFVLDMPVPDKTGYELEFSPVRLASPEGLNDSSRWESARRGWFNLLQVRSETLGFLVPLKWPAVGEHLLIHESTITGAQTPCAGGIWANNVVSNLVSSLTFMLGDHVLLVPDLAKDISLLPLLRRTIEYWMTEEILPDGRIFYVENGKSHPTLQPMMDSNPAVLIAAWDYVEASADEKWLRENIVHLEFISRYMESRDIDKDGLLESVQTGNSGSMVRPDCAIDTICSGHKNAYINALAYRAFLCMADLENKLGHTDMENHYLDLSKHLKSNFRKTFYNPETGWLGYWRSQDGVLHDIYSDMSTSLAIVNGLISKDDGRQMIERYWEELKKSGFTRFDLGVPLNVRHIPQQYRTKNKNPHHAKNQDKLGHWLNGGCCVLNTYYFLLANYIVGNNERADMILDAMLERQHKGVFPNGGGFQNGVHKVHMYGSEFFEWDGKPTGYEGHLVYSWAFLQTIMLRESKFREKVFHPVI